MPWTWASPLPAPPSHPLARRTFCVQLRPVGVSRADKKPSLWVASGPCGCHSCLGRPGRWTSLAERHSAARAPIRKQWVGSEGPLLGTCSVPVCMPGSYHVISSTDATVGWWGGDFTDEQTEPHDFLDSTLLTRARARIRMGPFSFPNVGAAPRKVLHQRRLPSRSSGYII